MFDQLEDTIAAVSTPEGRGTVGVLRISGAAAFEVSHKLFCPDNQAPCTNALTSGRVALQEARFLLPAKALYFLAPHSYTTEDSIEIFLPGCVAVLQQVLQRAIEGGARLAQPGEFTARAVHHGAVPLDQVDSIAELIHARSDDELRAAVEWFSGNLGQNIRAYQHELTDLVALVEADIDFAEEPIDFIAPSALRNRILHLNERLLGLIQYNHTSERMRVDPRVVFVGAPNVGKSSLLNALSDTERAIASPASGTTRDLLSTHIHVPRGVIELVDTAGLSPNSSNFEKIFKKNWEREIAHADLICYVVEPCTMTQNLGLLSALEKQNRPILWVMNKCDLSTSDQQIRIMRERGIEPVGVSAHRREGLETLRNRISAMVFSNTKNTAHQRLALSARKHTVLKQTSEHLQRAATWTESSAHMTDSAEWIAADLRSALTALGSLFGEVSTDDLLERIYSDFCIGK